MNRRAAAAITMFLLGSSIVLAYTFQGNTNSGNDGKPYHASLPVTYHFNDQTSDALSNVVAGSDPRAAINAGFAEWAAESGFSVTQGADSSNTDAGEVSGEYLVTFADTLDNYDIFIC